VTDWRAVIFKEQPGYHLYTLYASDNNNKPVGQTNIGGEKNVESPTQLTAGAWVHLAMTYDGINMKLYVNGALVATTPISGAEASSTSPLTLGGDRIWGEYFQGLIDDVRVYNRALSQSEIQSDMNTPVQ
jgi:hypothetical protein